MSSARQPDLFAGRADAIAPAPGLDPDTLRLRARERLDATLAQARAAEGEPPWPPHRVASVIMLFQQWANWLPPAEAEAMRAAFRAECDRLGIAAGP